MAVNPVSNNLVSLYIKHSYWVIAVNPHKTNIIISILNTAIGLWPSILTKLTYLPLF